MSNTSQLELWATKNISNFMGVYPSDKLPKTIKTPCSLIFNYDSSHLPGSHWVAVWISKNVYWFDSFGMPPDADDLIIGHKSFFKQWLINVCSSMNLKNYSWNTLDLQSLDAKTCGHYSLYFCKNGPYKGWEDFNSNTKNNDIKIRQLVKF